jgi:hypothetical protein
MMLSATAFDAAQTGQLTPQAIPFALQLRPGDGVDPHVTDHAVRRYAERVLHVVLSAGLSDPHAICELEERGIDVDWIRERIARAGRVAVQHGAVSVIADGVRMILEDGRVVSCLPRRGLSFLKRFS